MTTLLEAVGAAVWRASWQATVLALLVMLLLRLLGERMAPRWRYLLWTVVVIRLLLVTTPAAPWSAFNLVGWKTEAGSPTAVAKQADSATAGTSQGRSRESQEDVSGVDINAQASPEEYSEVEAAISPQAATATPATLAVRIQPAAAISAPVAHRGEFIARALALIWLAGCALFALQLAIKSVVLHRRLAACRPVTDTEVLNLLELARRQAGCKRIPELLVTPDAISPCIAGSWLPRIIVPETIVTGASKDQLRHVLAHELAHLVRGDLWMNWLLLAARIMHWFNPVAWWTIRAVQAERESACDELALAALGEADRPAYAATIVELARALAPSALAPAMIGLFSSAGRLKARVERLVQRPSVIIIPTPLAAACLLALALLGLTDAIPAAGPPAPGAPRTQAKSAVNTASDAANAEMSRGGTVSLRGRCLDYVDKSSIAGVRVRLFKAEGRTAPIVEAANTVTDDKGRFEFPELIPPRPHLPVDQFVYLLTAEADGRPLAMRRLWEMGGADPLFMEIHILREATTLSGTILNSRGQPLTGAKATPWDKIALWDIDGREHAGMLSSTSGADGRFEIKRVPDYAKARGDDSGGSFAISVLHPDHPRTILRVPELPADVEVVLPDGCVVTGTVMDAVTGKPATDAVVVAIGADELAEFPGPIEIPAAINSSGRFRLMLAEGRYSFRVDAKDRVCVALTDRECPAGQTVELPQFDLIGGGFISGRVVNAASKEPVVSSDRGGRIALGFYGPSQPKGRFFSPIRHANVDDAGHFTLRAAPGDNYPYFVNNQGDRMAWNTLKQPPVVVKAGETTRYDMLITPPASRAEKLAAARKFVESLPRQPIERTARILLVFRKLSQTVDETELWCTLIRELVAMGPDAVPKLCAELDFATSDRMLRRLAFALRAIGDPRAVPALIRALPRTLLPSSSDYGLPVEDAELTKLMQQRNGQDEGETLFRFGRPVREVCSALSKLTGHTTDEAELFDINRSEDPRREILQRRRFQRKAERWQTWWEEHWQEFTADAAYHKVNLKVVDEPLPPVSRTLGAQARLGSGIYGAILSPAIQGGRHAMHFSDLDTRLHPRWPENIAKDEGRFDQRRLAAWAAEKGVDLMCITHRAPDGTETFVLRAFNLKAWEISPRDLRNLDKLIAAGKLPEGRPVGDLLMHYDEKAKQLVPDANAAFIYLTREGSLGLIETTDRVTLTVDLARTFTDPPPGVGFFKGIRYNHKEIIP